MNPTTATGALRHTAANVRKASTAFVTKLATAVIAAVTLIAMLIGVVVAAQPAYAQDETPAIVASSHDITPGETFTAAVSFDPAGVDVGAVSLILRYDTTSLEAQSCAASGTGICHLTPGSVRLALVNTERIDATAELMTVDFVVLAAAATSELTVDLNTMGATSGERLSDVQVSPGLISASTEAPQLLGGLNGEVLDADGAGVFAAQVCALGAAGVQTCTETSGLGSFAIDDLPSGDYSVTITDSSGALASAVLATTVSAPDVTTGLSATLSPVTGDQASTEEPAAVDSTDAPADITTDISGAEPAVTAPPLASLSAAEGEIVVRVVDVRDAPVSGAEVCATAPVVGTQACAVTDVTGIVRLSGLPVSNYRLTAIVDPELRFDSPEPLLVGLNPGAGIVAELVFADEDLGDPPEALAYVNPEIDRSTSATALVTTGLGIVGLTTMAWFNRRSEERSQ